MKKRFLYSVLTVAFVCFSAFGFHKFYVAIYQINYNQKEKRLEITSRIFIDDLNEVLKLKYNKKVNLASIPQSNDDIELMKKYMTDNFSIKVNGAPTTINYLSNELEANVLICYFNIKNISKVKKLEIRNAALIDLNSEQQNIIQTTIYGKKRNLLLTENQQNGLIIVE